MAPAVNVPAVTNSVLSKIVIVRAGGLVVPGPWSTNTTGIMSVTLPKPTRLEISYAPIDSVANEPIRLLRKLEGLDEKWEEAGGQMQVGEMQLMVMIEDASNRILSHGRFAIRGDSEGWRGHLAGSEFLPRRETILLPSGTRRLRVLLTSQFWTVLGCAAITDFRVLRQDDLGEEKNIWPDPHIEQGENLDQPEGVPRHWERSSLGRRMAQVLTLPPPAKGHALSIMDDDVRASATWQAELPLENPAEAGETIALEWREAFSVGIGGRSRATFNPVSPGTYVFRVKTVTPFGEPIGSELALTIFIPQPLWKRLTFIIPVSLASAAAIAALVWFAANRRLQSRLNQLEYRRQREHERLRIARDIHDDLGASLTQMSLLSQAAHGKLQSSDPAWPDTERLRTVAVRLTQKLDEIVWAVSPQHDTLESLLSYLTDFAEEFLEAAGIRARIHIPLQLPDWTLPSSLRHNVFLSAKEALNNAVKHARATEIHLQVAVKDHAFELTIEDNGCGFSPPPPSPLPKHPSGRHGLDGMRNRMASIGADFTLDTAPGRGTRVTFTVPVTIATP
jgi:signal transduction histidine kinase